MNHFEKKIKKKKNHCETKNEYIYFAGPPT